MISHERLLGNNDLLNHYEFHMGFLEEVVRCKITPKAQKVILEKYIRKIFTSEGPVFQVQLLSQGTGGQDNCAYLLHYLYPEG